MGFWAADGLWLHYNTRYDDDCNVAPCGLGDSSSYSSSELAERLTNVHRECLGWRERACCMAVTLQILDDVGYGGFIVLNVP